VENEFDSSSFGLGASVLFYGAGTENVRTYWSPRLAWARLSFDDGNDDESNSAISVSGSFGAQYNPVPRFSVFGEIGLEYARSSSSYDAGPETFESTSSGFGTRTAVGVILYFGRS
jgi:hypothetical protein